LLLAMVRFFIGNEGANVFKLAFRQEGASHILINENIPFSHESRRRAKRWAICIAVGARAIWSPMHQQRVFMRRVSRRINNSKKTLPITHRDAVLRFGVAVFDIDCRLLFCQEGWNWR